MKQSLYCASHYLVSYTQQVMCDYIESVDMYETEEQKINWDSFKTKKLVAV